MEFALLLFFKIENMQRILRKGTEINLNKLDLTTEYTSPQKVLLEEREARVARENTVPNLRC